MTRRPAFAPALLAIVFAAVTCLGVGLTAVRASAVFQPIAETGATGYLSLAVDSATPLEARLGPGDSMRWLVRAALGDAESSTLAIELRANGELVEAAGMTAAVETCSGAFDLSAAPGDAPACQGSPTTVLPTTPLAAVSQSADRYDLAQLRRGEPRQLLVTLAIPAATPGDALDGLTARVGLGVHAAGDDGGDGGTVVPVQPTPVPPKHLAVTGADALALGVLATGLAGLGLAAALRGRSRTRLHAGSTAGEAR